LKVNTDKAIHQVSDNKVGGWDISPTYSPNIVRPSPISPNSFEVMISNQEVDFMNQEMDKEAQRYRPQIKISSSIPFNFSTQEYTTEDLENVSHSVMLEHSARPFVCLNLDPYLMGVGGDDSWTASVHKPYILPPKKYNFDFKFEFF
jgi:hypothetical protein